ncbi:MAG: hypothetical protein ACREK5_09315 [Gemmatimonadota bacterium]
MRTRHLLGFALLLTASPAVVQAQEVCGGYLQAPPVGDWAEYRVSKEGETELGLRFAIVGSEQRNGHEMTWFEMAITPEGEDESTIMKLLVPGYPFGPDGLEEIIMKAGDSPAIRMGGPMLATMRKSIDENPGFSIVEQCKAMQDAGEESVTVAAGTFHAHHYRNADSGTDAWLSKEVPFGMIRSTDGEYTSELVAHGEGAQTAITETPQDPFGSR